ncbi:MAG: (2Fe-2S)-binding protein [Bacteroidota bacterium]|nr:(2Fe-2S)-binding protein [Bacteroidota bacterium]
MKTSEKDLRINKGVIRGKEIEIIVDGESVKAFEGESVAAALFANGQRISRSTTKENSLRGMYCGIGMCFECVMTIDNIPNTRTCQTFVREGMFIETQQAEGKWKTV